MRPEWAGRNASEVYRVETPSFASLLRISWYAARRYQQGWEAEFSGRYHWPSSMLSDVRERCSISLVDVLLVLLMSALWPLLRAKLSRDLFQPLGRSLRLLRRNQAKLPESCWKLLFYSLAFAWCLCSLSRHRVFADPLSIWDEWRQDMRIGWDIRALYLVQISFYIYGIYATLFLDDWRKDSRVMVAHHFLALLLLVFSLSIKQHMIGALVLLLHDCADILLEFTKIHTYLKHRGGKTYIIHEWLAGAGFVAFAITWFLFRIYWFPLKVLYAAFYGGIELGGAPRLPFVPIFSGLLLALLIMNIWWFQFILLFLYKVATGQVHEVEDVREDEELNPQQSSSSITESVSNPREKIQ